MWRYYRQRANAGRDLQVSIQKLSMYCIRNYSPLLRSPRVLRFPRLPRHRHRHPIRAVSSTIPQRLSMHPANANAIAHVYSGTDNAVWSQLVTPSLRRQQLLRQGWYSRRQGSAWMYTCFWCEVILCRARVAGWRAAPSLRR